MRVLVACEESQRVCTALEIKDMKPTHVIYKTALEVTLSGI